MKQKSKDKNIIIRQTLYREGENQKTRNKMDRLRKIAVAQKARLLESLQVTPQSVLHAVVESDRYFTKVIIDGEDPTNASQTEASSPNTSSSPSSSSYFSTEITCAILRAIEDNKIVTHLTISNRSDAAEFISALTPLLSKNLTLKYLKIDSVYFGDDLSLPLFGAMAKNSSIETAILNNIGITSMQSVLLLLNHTQVLKSLDLSNNDFDDDAFMSLADGLRRVSSHELRELRLVNTGVDDGVLNRLCCVLEESIDYCPGLRMLDCGTCEGVTDATRVRTNAVLETRRDRAVEIAKGGGNAIKGADASAASDLNSNGGGISSSPQKGSDAKSDRGSDSATAMMSARGEINSSQASPSAVATDSPQQEVPQIEVADSASLAPPDHQQGGLSRKASDIPPPTSSYVDTQAEISAAIAAATSQHEAKVAQLAILLGDSQSQSAKLQERLAEVEAHLATTQSDTRAIKDASKAMHTQFQQKVAETEAAAAGQLKEAASIIASLNAKVTEMAASAEKQRMSHEEGMSAHQATITRLSAENAALRDEYLKDLREAIEVQKRSLEQSAAESNPFANRDVEVQTEDVEVSAKAKKAATTSKQAAKGYRANAYDEAVSDFAMVDREEATDDQSRWKKDADVTHCTTCHKEFTLTRRRHHCRRCGNIYCSDCIVKSKVDKENVCTNCSRSETVLVANNAKK